MTTLKGIILAGGTGSRLKPATQVLSKQLLPVYDKPMVFYPLTTLMLAGVREILLISNTENLSDYERLLGDGRKWGISISYAAQEKPEGIAQAYLIAETFLNRSKSLLVLGDNIFYGNALGKLLVESITLKDGAGVFAYRVPNPKPYGVVEFDKSGKVISIEEKPENPKSNYIATGLYFFDESSSEIAKDLVPSSRGELEITDLLDKYLKRGLLKGYRLNRGFAWFDAGTPDSLLEAGMFVQTVEKRQGLKIACPEEVALRQGYITMREYSELQSNYCNSSYGDYLLDLGSDLLS